MDKRSVQEAVVVGAALLPIYSVVHEVVEELDLGRSTDLSAVFLSGVAFHLIAEATGLNEWYIHHGAATDKWLSSTSTSKQNVGSRSCSSDARICPLAVRLGEGISV